MTKHTIPFGLVLCFAAGLVCTACGSDESEPSDSQSVVECTVDSDCPGADNYCDLASNTCTGSIGGTDSESGADTERPGPDTEDDPPPSDSGSRDTGTEDTDQRDTWSPPTDTSRDDTSDPDTGGRDTGTVDTGPIDTGLVDTGGTDTAVDTGLVDTGSDTGTDAGNPFSGCQSDSDCAPYQVCNQTLGRCEDARPICTVNSDCASDEYCLGGRCSPTCGGLFDFCPRGLSCKGYGGTGGPKICSAICDTFDGSGTRGCGADTQCVPFFGASEGLCRGTGRNRLGSSCQTDWGPEGCREGNLCVDNRGDKRCKKLCAESSQPNCASNEYCSLAFTTDASQNTVSNPAGFCFDNCGGLGNTDDSKCSSSKACQPDSASDGFCTAPGTAGPGSQCGLGSTPYCQVGNYCLPTTTQNQGICRGACDPGKMASNNVCTSSQACVEVETGFGLCIERCSSTGTTTSQCPSERPYCASTGSMTNTTPQTPGICLESSP